MALEPQKFNFLGKTAPETAEGRVLIFEAARMG
jgi:hypothetical protein